jgi:hypothetical protein
MKFALLALLLSPPAVASVTANSFAPGAPCALEGERFYEANGENDDVYFCENGVWKFLYTQTPDDDQD